MILELFAYAVLFLSLFGLIASLSFLFRTYKENKQIQKKHHAILDRLNTIIQELKNELI